jgi:hypothetical protein
MSGLAWLRPVDPVALGLTMQLVAESFVPSPDGEDRLIPSV